MVTIAALRASDRQRPVRACLDERDWLAGRVRPGQPAPARLEQASLISEQPTDLTGPAGELGRTGDMGLHGGSDTNSRPRISGWTGPERRDEHLRSTPG